MCRKNRERGSTGTKYSICKVAWRMAKIPGCKVFPTLRSILHKYACGYNFEKKRRTERYSKWFRIFNHFHKSFETNDNSISEKRNESISKHDLLSFCDDDIPKAISFSNFQFHPQSKHRRFNQRTDKR